MKKSAEMEAALAAEAAAKAAAVLGTNLPS
jgi:hypothetical protein